MDGRDGMCVDIPSVLMNALKVETCGYCCVKFLNVPQACTVHGAGKSKYQTDMDRSISLLFLEMDFSHGHM